MPVAWVGFVGFWDEVGIGVAKSCWKAYGFWCLARDNRRQLETVRDNREPDSRCHIALPQVVRGDNSKFKVYGQKYDI